MVPAHRFRMTDPRIQIISVTSSLWMEGRLATDKAFGGELYTSLRQGKRRYRKGCGKKRSPIPDAVSIEQRPAVVDVGSRVGDWEADLVLGKQGTGTIGTPADRKSHIYLTIKTQPKWPRPLSQCWVVVRLPYHHVRQRQGVYPAPGDRCRTGSGNLLGSPVCLRGSVV